MIVDVPFYVETTGFRPRQRTESARLSVETVPVKLREISSENAPVVASGRFHLETIRRQEAQPDRTESGLVMSDIDYRVHNGQLLRRATLDITLINDESMYFLEGNRASRSDNETLALLTEIADSEVGLPITKDRINGAMKLIKHRMGTIGGNYLVKLPGEAAHNQASGNIPELDLAPNRITGNDRRARSAEVTRDWEDVAIIDGELYLPSFGPYWIFHTRGGDCPHLAEACPDIGLSYGRKHRWRSEVFQPYDVDGIIEKADKGVEFAGEIDATPVSFSFDHVSDVIMREIAREVEKRCADTILKTKSPDMLRSLADIYEVLADNDVSGAEMTDAFTVIADEWERMFDANSPIRWVSNDLKAAVEFARRSELLVALQNDVGMDALKGLKS